MMNYRPDGAQLKAIIAEAYDLRLMARRADQIDLAPFERAHFRRNAPAGDVGEFDHRAQSGRQMCENTMKHLQLEESLFGVSFFEHRNMRSIKKLAALHRPNPE